MRSDGRLAIAHENTNEQNGRAFGPAVFMPMVAAPSPYSAGAASGMSGWAT